jgi:pyruvate/2-oxoglutarate dehydrogenase complex dihydrolipoamide acyltransferase (E2) component
VTGTRRTLVKLPQASVAVTEGTIVRWLVAEGDRVAEGQPLYLLETDKIEMEVESPAAGTVHLLGEAGATYAVGADVGYVDGPAPGSGAGSGPGAGDGR